MDRRSHLTQFMTVYTDYVAKKYGEAIIICVVCGEPSTKDMKHLRQNKGQTGMNVTFAEEMQLSMKKATFLSNSTNKQRFINMLGCYLEEKKSKVYHTPRDADLLIVEKAVELSTVIDTVLVGDDTDLFVLLCYHASIESYSIFFFFFTRTQEKHQKFQSVGYQGCKGATGA